MVICRRGEWKGWVPWVCWSSQNRMVGCVWENRFVMKIFKRNEGRENDEN
jgi:hypothetical protein